jgi:hypothetical protein
MAGIPVIPYENLGIQGRRVRKQCQNRGVNLNLFEGCFNQYSKRWGSAITPEIL